MKTLVVLFCLLWAEFIFAQQTVTQKFILDWKNNDPKQTGSNIYRDGKLIAKVAQGVATYNEVITGPAKQQYCWEVTAVTVMSESGKSNRTCMALPDAPIKPSVAPPAKVDMTFVNATGEIVIDGKTTKFTNANGAFKLNSATAATLNVERVPP